MTTSQIALLLERIGGIEGAVTGIKDDLRDLRALVLRLENDRIGREAVEEHGDKADVRRRNLITMGLSAAGVGASVATAVYVILHASGAL